MSAFLADRRLSSECLRHDIPFAKFGAASRGTMIACGVAADLLVIGSSTCQQSLATMM
jgi:hypothetical protein